MAIRRAFAIAATVAFSTLGSVMAAPQLMSTCAEDSPEKLGKPGCTVIATKELPEGLKAPVYWHIDRFPSVQQARAAAGAAGVGFEAYGTPWLVTIEAQTSNHHGGEHVAQVGPLPLPAASRYKL